MIKDSYCSMAAKLQFIKLLLMYVVYTILCILTNEVYYLNNLIYFNILIATLINELHK